jgi:hypothetical protein
MTRPKPKIRSIFEEPDADIGQMMDAVDQVADAENIGNIARPSDNPAPLASTSSASDSNVTPLTPRRVRKVNPAQTSRGTVELPTYLWNDIAEKTVKEKVTKRYLVLKAFKDAGYTVHDVDLFKDGRRES